MDIVSGSAATFFTNCFRYDERIGDNLATNPASGINLSIDAGTPETWHRVKGRDNFLKVKENLARYYERSLKNGQITLKYIVMPGINDGEQDYKALAELMISLGVDSLFISRDVRYKYKTSDEQSGHLPRAVGTLLRMLSEAGLSGDPHAHYFSPKEIADIEAYAKLW